MRKITHHLYHLEKRLINLTDKSIQLGKEKEHQRLLEILETALNASALTWTMEYSKGFRQAIELVKENK